MPAPAGPSIASTAGVPRSGRNDSARLVFAHHQYGVSAREYLNRLFEGLMQVVLLGKSVLDQVGDNLRICF